MTAETAAGPLLTPERTLVMGIVNVTPDSFSDGGRYLAADSAVAHGRALAADGADILDIGGESTRPGSERVDAATEIARVVPVIERLAETAVISVDTINAVTAAAAVRAGATIVNDVSGGLADPGMARVVAEHGAVYLIQHWRGTPETMNDLAVYEDVVGEVIGEIGRRVDEALAAGMPRELIVIDPGLGFAKDPEHNWAILAHLERVQEMGYPVLVGASRKRFLGGAVPPEVATIPTERDAATVAVTALAAAAGVWGVRVHDARSSRDAVRVAQAVRDARGSGSPAGRGGGA